MIALANQCRLISHIKLTYCRKITDAGLSALVQSCSNLTSIQLMLCTQITDTGFTTLVKNCPGLEEINLVGCSKITDAGLSLLPDRCSLTKVHLGGLSWGEGQWCAKHRDLKEYKRFDQITDSGLIAVAKACPSLSKITITDCRITDAALKVLAQSCPALCLVGLANCGMPIRGLESIIKNCSQLKIVNALQEDEAYVPYGWTRLIFKYDKRIKMLRQSNSSFYDL